MTITEESIKWNTGINILLIGGNEPDEADMFVKIPVKDDDVFSLESFVSASFELEPLKT